MCAVKLNTPPQPIDAAVQAQLPSWLQHTEEMELSEIGRNMHSMLHRHNHTKLDVNNRHQIMKALQDPILKLLGGLEQRYLGCPSNTSRVECQESARQIRQLLHEICNTYSIIIHQLAVEESSSQQHSLLAYNISCALRYQGRHLMDHFFTYQPISGDIWGEIKLLFRYARQCELENTELYDQDNIPHTIAEIFLSTLLFASINPFRLKQQEIIDSYQVVTRWARHCQLLPCDKQWLPKGEWVIDLSSERPPEYLKSGQAILDRSSLLRVDITQLLNQVQQNVTLDGYGQLPSQLLDRLQHGWKSSPPRSYERRSSFQETEIVVGLNHCQQLLIEHEVAHSPQNSDEDPLWSMHLANRMLEEEMCSDQKVLHELYEVDVSIGGYGLRCPQHNSEKIRKLDLVLIRHPNIQNEHWRIGQVRWKQSNTHDSDTMLGICLLSEEASAVIISHAQPGKDSALLIPGDDFDNPLATLLVPDHYQAGDTLQCRSANQRVNLKLLEAVCSGADFIQFRFERINKQHH